MNILAIPAFNDNYIWCLHDQAGSAVVVDPGDGQATIAGLDQHGLSLAAIFVTHHHMDHTGGLNDLLAHNPVPVYGSSNSHIDAITRRLTEGDRINVLGTTFSIFATPGHTLDHIAFYTEDTRHHPSLFCGDTLFCGGCGRLFEGDPAMMHASLAKLSTLPGDTAVYCAHEYTVANLEFATRVDPENAELSLRLADALQTRSKGRPTVPSSIALENKTNPFLRCDNPALQAATRAITGEPCTDVVGTFAAVRALKDRS